MTRGQSDRCEAHRGRHDIAPVRGGTINSVRYDGMDDATCLDGSYPSQAFLPSVCAHPVLDFSENVGDK